MQAAPGWCGCNLPGAYIQSGRGYRARAARSAAVQQSVRCGAAHAENALGCPCGGCRQSPGLKADYK